ncbi:MAG: hypothetical protein H7250_10875 [Flavobacterium sp.]|nr:hypothetical protein [Flavobacterium sp.]
MKIKIILFCFFLFQSVFSQKEFLDYLVTEKNDTIYGTFRNNALFEKNLYPEKDGIKFYSHKISKMKIIRFNDDIYFRQAREDGIYKSVPARDSSNFVLKTKGSFLNKKPRLQEFIVLVNNDTIYGEISEPMIGNLYLSDKNGKKHKIKNETIKTYRFRNELYEFKEKTKVDLFDTKESFLKVLAIGKVNLYEYEYQHDNATKNRRKPKEYYFIEKDGQLILLNSIIGGLKIKKKLTEIFKDNNDLVRQISDDVYGLQNIYLILKKYNSN